MAMASGRVGAASSAAASRCDPATTSLRQTLAGHFNDWIPASPLSHSVQNQGIDCATNLLFVMSDASVHAPQQTIRVIDAALSLWKVSARHRRARPDFEVVALRL